MFLAPMRILLGSLLSVLFAVPRSLLPFPPILILFATSSFLFLLLPFNMRLFPSRQFLITDGPAKHEEGQDGRQNETDGPAHSGDASGQAIEEYTGENSSKRIGEESPHGEDPKPDSSEKPHQVHQDDDNQAASGADSATTWR